MFNPIEAAKAQTEAMKAPARGLVSICLTNAALIADPERWRRNRHISFHRPDNSERHFQSHRLRTSCYARSFRRGCGFLGRGWRLRLSLSRMLPSIQSDE